MQHNEFALIIMMMMMTMIVMIMIFNLDASSSLVGAIYICSNVRGSPWALTITERPHALVRKRIFKTI